MRFVSSLGTSQEHLKFEKVRFDATNKKAEYFVKIPSVSSTTDTYFYLLYGRTGALDGSDKTEVYGDEFKAVYHMKDDPDTSHIKDSTINGNNGTKKAANEPIEADGKVEKVQSFDGSNDYIDTFDIPVMSTFSFSSLVKLDTIKDCGIITDHKSCYFYPAYFYRIDANGKVSFTKDENEKVDITGISNVSI